MIRSLSISNYRSVGERTQIPLESVTALVGQNGSGKSNIVDALRFLSESVSDGLEVAVTKRHGIDAVRRWSSGRPYDMTIGVDMRGDQVSGSYEFTLAGDQKGDYRVRHEQGTIQQAGETSIFELNDSRWIKGPEDLRPEPDKRSLALTLIRGDRRFKPLADLIRSVEVYSINPDTLRRPQEYNPKKPMLEHGENWVSIMKDQDAGSWKPDLLAGLGKLTEDIEDIQVQAVGGYLVARFKHRSSSAKAKWFDSSQQSDGTLRCAGLLMALLQDPAVPVIGIEEPELTIHVGALPLLFDYIRQASRSSQVVLTTHSAELMELLDIDSIRIVEKREGTTRVGVMSSGQREMVRERLRSIGEIHRNEGLQLDLPVGEPEGEED